MAALSHDARPRASGRHPELSPPRHPTPAQAAQALERLVACWAARASWGGLRRARLVRAPYRGPYDEQARGNRAPAPKPGHRAAGVMTDPSARRRRTASAPRSASMYAHTGRRARDPRAAARPRCLSIRTRHRRSPQGPRGQRTRRAEVRARPHARAGASRSAGAAFGHRRPAERRPRRPIRPAQRPIGRERQAGGHLHPPRKHRVNAIRSAGTAAGTLVELLVVEHRVANRDPAGARIDQLRPTCPRHGRRRAARARSPRERDVEVAHANSSLAQRENPGRGMRRGGRDERRKALTRTQPTPAGATPVELEPIGSDQPPGARGASLPASGDFIPATRARRSGRCRWARAQRHPGSAPPPRSRREAPRRPRAS
jgi:hypothetical protein